MSVLTERSEENLTEYQRTIQSIQQQRALLQELEHYKQRNEVVDEEEVQAEEAVDGQEEAAQDEEKPVEDGKWNNPSICTRIHQRIYPQ